MRGKRSKQYRKLMQQFSQTFGFREPYQVLVDAEMVTDSCRFKMDLQPALSRTVHGQVKPMLTQCSMRHLYATRNEAAIDLAKTFERRRCGHHPDQYPEPLSTQECLRSVVDPKDTNQNKHRYVVASQDQEVRRMLRGIKGVPLIYIKRSVMVLEPMADESVQVRVREERSKFRAEIKSTVGKRKREDDDDDDEKADKKDASTTEDQKKKKKKGHGPKGPNPLAVQKSKKPKTDGQQPRKKESSEVKETPQEGDGKRKRRRRTKATSETVDQGQANDTTTAEVTMADA